MAKRKILKEADVQVNTNQPETPVEAKREVDVNGNSITISTKPIEPEQVEQPTQPIETPQPEPEPIKHAVDVHEPIVVTPDKETVLPIKEDSEVAKEDDYPIFVGVVYDNKHGRKLEVIAIARGYLMAQYCYSSTPICLSVSDFKARAKMGRWELIVKQEERTT